MFGKSFNTSKLKGTINNALARIAILKKQHHVRWSQARSDVVQLLNLGHQESAILRVDHMIREQNLLDAMVIVEGYCCLLLERMELIRNTIKCPEELKEAIASLIFAASRYGQLPELQKISRIFMKKYGKEFINNAVELRNSCGVNAKIAKRLPNRRTSLGTRTKVLKEIAAEHRIILQQESENHVVTEVQEEKKNTRKTAHLECVEPKIDKKSPEEKAKNEIPKTDNRFKDAKQAAKAACELATQAAAAAKAAVELSHTKLHDNSDDDHNHHPRKATHNHNEDALFKDAKPWKAEKQEEGTHKNDAFEAHLHTQMLNKRSSIFTSESDADTDKQKVDESKLGGGWDNEKRFSSFMHEFIKVQNYDADKDENYSTEGSRRGRRPISVRTRQSAATPRRIRRPVSRRP